MIRDNSSKAVERLTALWALNEAGLGGLLHAVKSPFAGIIVGGVAILLISLIAWYSEKRFIAILKAAMIVLIIKAAVSPHSPLPAYAAVSFQALAGAVFFTLITNFRAAALLAGITGLLESAFQKLLFLTILYGNSLWESIDLFFAYIIRQFGIAAPQTGHGASCWLIMSYIGIHAVAGVCAGLLAGRLPRAVTDAMDALPPLGLQRVHGRQPAQEGARRRKHPRVIKILRYFLTVSIIAGVLTFLTPAMAGADRGVFIILRTVAVILAWYFLVAPLLMKGLRRFLRKREAGYGRDIENILALFPHLKSFAQSHWQETGDKKGWVRWRQFLVALIVFTLTFDVAQENPARNAQFIAPCNKPD